MIRIRLLGPIAATVDGGPAPPELTWKKHLALLIYLCRSPHRTRSRDHLLGLLWGDKPEAAARHSLNEALRIIRRAGGPAALDTTTDQVTLAPGVVSLDSDELEAALATNDFAGACGLVQGEFLEGFTLPDAIPFEDWLHAERRTWRDRGVAVLGSLARELARSGDPSAARALAERAVRLDPNSERAARALIESLIVSDDGPTAVAEFEHFRAGIAERTGAVPSVDLVALIGQLKRHGGRSIRRPEAAAATHPRAQRAPLTGRDREIRLLREIWGRTRAGQASAVVILGDLGSGKTRLLEELFRIATLDGAVGSLFRAVEADRDRGGAGLQGLAVGGLAEARGIAGAPPAALATLAARLPEWSDRFPAVRGTDGLPLGDAFLAVVEAATADAPVLLAIDDAHWCDRESLQTLIAALRDCDRRPLLVVLGSVRLGAPAELDGLRSRLGEGQSGVALDLGPLGRESIAALTRLAGPDLDEGQLDRLARRIEADSGGSPLLVTGLLDALKGGFELKGAAAPWPATAHTLSETLPGDLPDSIIGAIRVGFRRLSSTAQQVLATASVLDDRIDPAKLVGSTIDQFHANPVHQRRLLADPKNLPARTDIRVGDQIFAINVSAMYDRTRYTHEGRLGAT